MTISYSEVAALRMIVRATDGLTNAECDEFADWLRDGFDNRKADPTPRNTETMRPELPDGDPVSWPLKQREGDQPLPVPNDSPDVQSMVIADITARRQVGIKRYGTALQPNNGRDALRDAYEEALDLACYLRQAIAERDAPTCTLDRSSSSSRADGVR